MDELMASSPITSKKTNTTKKSGGRPSSPRAAQEPEFKSKLNSYRKDRTPTKASSPRFTRNAGSSNSNRKAQSVPRSKMNSSGPAPRLGSPRPAVSKGSFRSPSTPVSRKTKGGDVADDFEKDLAIEVVPSGDQDKETNVEKLKEMFNATLARYGSNELKKRSFALLVKKCRPYLEIIHVPSDSDLYSAFDLADTDNSGQVDLKEFIEFCKILHQGEKNGFDTSNSITSTFQRQQELTEKGGGSKLKGSLRTKSGGSYNSGSQSRGRGTLITRKVQSSSPRLEQFGCNEDREYVTAAEALKNASDAWKARTAKGTLTIAAPLGNYASPTESYSQGVVLRHSQEDLREESTKQVNARKDTSLFLSDAKLEWQNRDRTQTLITVPDNMGSINSRTRSSRNKAERMSADNTPSAELGQLMSKNSRHITSIELLSAKDKWEKRKKQTKPQDVGNLGKSTSASKSRNETLPNSDNTGATEMIRKMSLNARSMLTEDSKKNSAEWKQRQGKRI